MYNALMYLRRCGQSRSHKDHVYWELVENQRTEQGPRQRVVAYLGDVDEAARIGIKQTAIHNSSCQGNLFGEDHEPEWVEVDVKRIRVEGVRDFGGYWIGLQIWNRLGLDSFLNKVVTRGREEIPWSAMAGVLVLMRLCDPSSELRIAEHLYERTALGELLGIPADKVNEDRLYRALDELLPHKAELEKHPKEKLGELFGLKYDLLLYDMTSTYSEGESARNPQARHGYSRDHRSDCRQVCIALVVSHWGIPLGYEVFGGNRADATTLEEIVEKVEAQYGRADRVWVMDRGMTSEENLQFLRTEGRRYIVGTAGNQLRQFERQLLNQDWQQVREGLEVKLCKGEDGEETFILCRSASRSQKEKAIHERFEKRIEEGLNKLSNSCRKRKHRLGMVERRVGRLLGANSRAAGLFQVDVKIGENDGAVVVWSKVEAWREWARLCEGCYLLRSNINDWTGEQLWKTYIQLTEAVPMHRDSHPQGRPADKTHMASDRRTSPIAHSGLLPGLCCVEDSGADVQKGWARGRAA